MSPTNTPLTNALYLVDQASSAENTQAHVRNFVESSDARPHHLSNVNERLKKYAITDALAMASGFLVAWALAAIVNYTLFSRSLGSPFFLNTPVRLVEFLLIAAGIITWLQHTDHYRIRMPFWSEAKKIIAAFCFAMLADGFLQFTSKHDFSRLWLVSGWSISAIAMICFRNALRAYWRRKGVFHIPTLMIGSGQTALNTRAALESEPSLGHKIVAQIEDLASAFLRAGKSWEQLCAAHGAAYVIIALDGQEMAAAGQPLAQLTRESVPFTVSPPLGHLPVIGMTPHYFFNHDVMLLARSSGLEQPLARFLKRGLDIFISACALAVLSLPMAVIALLIRRDGAAALFGHSRLGRHGKTFACLKFRSMVANGDAVLERYLAENEAARKEWQATRKLRHDPRVTRLGNFLRRTSIDELPQLFNVLRGDMSIVGPRPIVTAEVSNYEGDIMHYYRVRPGITGLWQVSGRSDVSYPQRVHMDSWYVRNWSLWNDIAILCKTFPALLKRSGAY